MTLPEPCSRHVVANRLRHHLLEWGGDGPVVLLLHGFPEMAYSWRKVMPALAGKEDWQVTVALANAMGCPMDYTHPSQIMDEIARLTPTFSGVSYDKLDARGSLQWPCNDEAPLGTETMHVDEFVRGKGFFALTEFVPTDERANRRFPLLLTTGRILSQYNVGAQTRRTANSAWHPEDVAGQFFHHNEGSGKAAVHELSLLDFVCF